MEVRNRFKGLDLIDRVPDLLGGKIPGSESWTDSEAGMKMGGGGAGWTQGHTFRKGIPMSRGEDCGV